MSHNYWLVAASLVISLMAGFSGLSLLKDASKLTSNRRKASIAMAAIALGGGIWSMHFVAMLGLQLPVSFFYDTLRTVISALIAILVVGLALLILHFGKRDQRSIVLAGSLVGVGILAMHYLGMSGMQLCLPVYSPFGIAFAFLASVSLSIATFWVAYSQRTHRNIVLGTVFFGVSVFTVHFVAMAGTSFVQIETTILPTNLISNEAMALSVALTSFLICAAFLLTGATFITASDNVMAETDGPTVPMADFSLQAVSEDVQTEISEVKISSEPDLKSVPYERDGRTYFLDQEHIAAIRAEGHYTVLYTRENAKVFCSWSLSEAAKRVSEDLFIRAHRSYLINPHHVSGFERKKDNGVCYFESVPVLGKVPVSRSRLAAVRDSLGL